VSNNVLTCTVVPCGGIVNIDLVSTDTGTWLLTRAPTANLLNTYILYEGPPLVLPIASPYYLDIGDGNNGPLNQQTNYTYTFTTWSGSVSQAITPASTIEIEYDDYLQLLVNMLSAGVQSLTPPAWLRTTGKPAVFISMPLVAQPPIPCITINEDLMQQEEVPIGHGINTDQILNFYQIQEIVNRRYRVTVITSSVQEREYWKLAVISLFKSILVPVLHKMGQDISSTFQAASSQINPPEAQPGFYFCDIMLEFSGILPVRITTSFPPVESFAFSVNEGQDNYEIPSNVPVLYNNGGYLSITFSTGWSTTEPLGPPGALWSNGYLVSVTPGSTPDPSAPPVFYGIIDAADLLALGGANLPLDDPFVINQLWNSGGLVVISSG
jgi:hypothetical protein